MYIDENLYYIAQFTEEASGTEYVLAIYADSIENAKQYIHAHYQVDESEEEIHVKQLHVRDGVQVLFEN
jgi:hypothetical protein